MIDRKRGVDIATKYMDCLRAASDMISAKDTTGTYQDEQRDVLIEAMTLLKIVPHLEDGDSHYFDLYADEFLEWDRIVTEDMGHLAAEGDDTYSETINAAMGTPITNKYEQDRLRAAEEKSNEDLSVYDPFDGVQLNPSDNAEEVKELLQAKTETRTVIDQDGTKHTETFRKPVSCGYNFLAILHNDHRFADLRLNVLRRKPERVIDGKRTPWEDADDADARIYIERVYGITSEPKYKDALAKHLQSVRYNPVQEAIESTAWDRISRVEEFLIRWAGADDNPVNRECSRLMFAGGIRRAYEPGCKFDYCIVLIGGQGIGKSTLCRWLALEDDFYTSLKTITGQKGSEAIQGKWIVEIEELLALYANGGNSMAEEAAKAFLSRQAEHYRKPYERWESDTLRTNIFIGTTNQNEFLEDPTGNRRWYPVTCHCDGINLFEHEQECRMDIRQAWAEMLTAYRAGDPLANPYTSRNLEAEIRERQRSAEVDDGWVGRIEEYLDHETRVNKVCLDELWYEAINYGSRLRQPSSADKRRIGAILTTKLGWIRGNTDRFEPYGRQKSFLRPSQLPSVESSVDSSVDTING